VLAGFFLKFETYERLRLLFFIANWLVFNQSNAPANLHLNAPFDRNACVILEWFKSDNKVAVALGEDWEHQ